MDSLTQFVLGAAIGHVVLRRHMSAGKAMLIGGVAGTLPDLDILPLINADLVTSLRYHRSVSHSLLFSTLAPALIAYLQTRWSSLKTRVGLKKPLAIPFWTWYALWFWGFLTHIAIDACTTWGTQVFWPLPHRVSLNSIFIIDPLYTVPLLLSLLAALWYHHTEKQKPIAYQKSHRMTWIGLAISTCYLLWGFAAKTIANHAFEHAFRTQNIPVIRYMTRPTPFNSILWTVTAELPDSYVTGYYSLLDTTPITFSAPTRKNQEILQPYLQQADMRYLLDITEGYYRVTWAETKIAIHDLRFGDFGGWDGRPGEDVFVYLFDPKTGLFSQQDRNISQAKSALRSLYKRILGNH